MKMVYIKRLGVETTLEGRDLGLTDNKIYYLGDARSLVEL